jgi:hypothetical protein
MINQVRKISEAYLHVSNGGISFRVTNQYGPTLEIETSSFGNLNQKLVVHTTIAGLQDVYDMLGKALEHLDYSEPYCHPARPTRTIPKLGDVMTKFFEKTDNEDDEEGESNVEEK